MYIKSCTLHFSGTPLIKEIRYTSVLNSPWLSLHSSPFTIIVASYPTLTIISQVKRTLWYWLTLQIVIAGIRFCLNNCAEKGRWLIIICCRSKNKLELLVRFQFEGVHVELNYCKLWIVTGSIILLPPSFRENSIQAYLGYYVALKLRFFTPGPIGHHLGTAVSSRDGCYLAMGCLPLNITNSYFILREWVHQYNGHGRGAAWKNHAPHCEISRHSLALGLIPSMRCAGAIRREPGWGVAL
jgi:hypothetical protein